MPIVIDADGINAFAGRAGALRKRQAPTIMTPHAGELGRLLDVPAAEIANKRLSSAKTAARKTGAIIVLKGSATIITDGRTTFINPSGNPGLATAGSGDVLTGLIATLMSKGLDPIDAAAGGALIHGIAADEAAGSLVMDNLISSDLIDYLPDAFAVLEGEEQIEREH